MPPGVRILLNSGASEPSCPLVVGPDRSAVAEFYAQDLGTANLELLARFFDMYPDYADRTFLAVKVTMRRRFYAK